MWLSINAFLFPFGLFIVFAAATETCNPKSCNKDIQNEKAVCGSDNLTYPNRCIFEKTRCQNKTLTLVRRGPCRTQLTCGEWESLSASNTTIFKPKCREDGSYDSAQCLQEVGYCWCVTPEGVPLPYTSVKRKPDAKPRCGRKKSTKRRSPNKRNRNRVCKQRDKAVFNTNLINIFHTDYTLSHSGSMNANDTFILNWKFNKLDFNKDGVLDKNEYRDLKKIAKKAVKPKRCSKNFTRACDVNGDELITNQEWADCLDRNGMDDSRGANATSDPGDGGDGNSEDYEDLMSQRAPPKMVLTEGDDAMDRNYDDGSSEIREDDPTDCLTDRKTALAEDTQLYVPDCTPDGRYQKIQCYKSAGYCWCVHEDTGKHIAGTSVKNGTPKCDQLTTVSRPLKGCPDDKKSVFLRELLQFLHVKMTQINGTNSFNGLAWIASKEEQAATWSFVVYDKNKNKVLDRNEWKAFKELVSTVKGLRKCGKKLPRYCDINKDRQISMTEWLECLNVQQASSTSSPSSTRSGKKTLNMLMED